MLEVALDAEPEPAPLSVRVRVPVGPVAGADWPSGVLVSRFVLIIIRGGAVPHVCALVSPVLWVLWGWQSADCGGLGV